MNSYPHPRWAVSLLVAWLTHGQVQAQPQARSEPRAAAAAQGLGDRASQVVPPKLIHFVEAEFPPAAELAEAVVVLELTIGADGAVERAELVQGAGQGFDERALAAARQFIFTPAVKQGVAVASRIRYHYEFRAVVPAVEAGSGGASVNARASGAAGEATAPSASGAAGAAGEATAPSHPASEGAGEALADPAAASSSATRVAVVVQGESDAERLQRSARAVSVVTLDDARARTASLGEVLSRQEGVSVRNTGGLGAYAEFTLEGLSGDQVRFFIDGVPLRLSGYSLGVANAPLQFLDRVEIYRGVVPVRFGADALGGAVNLVSLEQEAGTHAAASVMSGSFGTQRVTGSAAHRDAERGWFTRAHGFWDRADNDYPITVEVPDADGRLAPARVRRFHDGYQAWGATLDAGVVDRPWARHLVLRAFQTAHEREVQHARTSMQVPYGEVAYERRARGAQLHYSHAGRRTRVDAKLGYTAEQTEFVDLARCRYDWRGQCRELPLQGEIRSLPIDQRRTDQVWFARIDWLAQVAAGHELHVSFAPTQVRQSGRDDAIAADAYDALRAGRQVATHVAGMEYHTSLFDGSLTNVLFGKSYQMLLSADEVLPNGNHRSLQRAELFGGWGDSLRWAASDALYFKAAYEYALRLPNPEEIFGDGVLILENLRLRRERSHNLNLGAYYDSKPEAHGEIAASLSGFARYSTDLIRTLFAGGAALINENVPKVTTLGLHGAASWTAPGRWLSVAANATWQELRNRSRRGTYGPYGDRIPNQPYLLANAHVRLQHTGLIAGGDRIRLEWNSDYVHEFYKAWESQGASGSKLVVPAQLVHDVGVVYSVASAARSIDISLESSNITDVDAYDYFGVQRPGRAFYFKIAVGLSRRGTTP